MSEGVRTDERAAESMRRGTAPEFEVLCFAGDAGLWTVVEVRRVYLAKVPSKGAGEALARRLLKAEP